MTLISRLRGMLGSSATQSPLAATLSTYRPLELPHKGDPLALSTEQANENLSAWTTAIPERMQALEGLLREAGQATDVFEFPPDLADKEAAVATVTALHSWASSSWGAVAASMHVGDELPWRQQRRDGDKVAFSMTADVAMLIGEVIRFYRPSWRWAIDHDKRNTSDGMGSVNRVVLLAEWLPDPTTQVELDLDELIARFFLQSPKHGAFVEDRWTKLVTEAISGAHEGAHLLG